MSISDWIDVVWSLLLEEGRGGFMDAGKYREVMTGLFWRGETPEMEDRPTGASGKPVPATPKKSKIEELRAFNDAIAARNRPAE